jgi:hypothetical protein
MQVTSKQTLIFRVAGQKDFVLHPEKHPVAIDAYIMGTQLYKLALSDGTIQEFLPVAPAPAAPAVDEKAKAEAEAKAVADKAAADAKAKADAEKAK